MPDQVKVETKAVTNAEGRTVFEIWKTVTKENGEMSVTRIGENVRPADCTTGIADCERKIQEHQDGIASLLKDIERLTSLKAEIIAAEAAAAATAEKVAG